MAGQIKVDSINADSNLALKIANTAVAFIDSSGLRPISGNVNLDATATSKLYLPSANTVAIQTAGVTGLSISSSQVVTLANALAVTSGGTGVTTSTGTGAVVLGTSPVFTTTIGVGAATASASGSGITFPATQSASSDANTLDDYEEGTWTPSLGGTATYTTRLASYVKVGRLVTVFCYISVNSIGTGSAIQISGLPFSVSSDIGAGSGAISYLASIATSVVFITAYGNSGLPTTVQFRTLTAAGATAGNASIFQNSAIVEFTMTYVT